MNDNDKNILTWDEVKSNITALDDIDKKEIEIIGAITAKRMLLKLSQRDLAKLTGIKQPAIARMESFRAMPKLRTLIIIAKALKLEIKLE